MTTTTCPGCSASAHAFNVRREAGALSDAHRVALDAWWLVKDDHVGCSMAADAPLSSRMLVQFR